ncbi:glycoside hydrolase family 43 protein [Alkalihalobacillus trypoxylicola]|uniref:Glycoside hydrolase n=1 Tax=Alkalihalobacillus trypoxylicola TaxID=519424 RepID=A0A162ES31_9BACI|nr:glycoside hydrolase family 43 protein [Alkalihalobacillus trypoxylicola]KYG33578.1 glycoside hydrolase [Alkalihalobacillus trypoxylicola]
MLRSQDIRIRDPFVYVDKSNQIYYLYGTTDENVWSGEAYGFQAYQSKDLENWEGPYDVFKPQDDFWADRHFWAPEVHYYRGSYYMFASFKSEDKCRGTQILKSDLPLGPYQPITEEPITPREWECLDGTLYIDGEEKPWIIYCHEWLQITEGKIYAQKLSEDLRETISEPILLINAADAKWTNAVNDGVYVTDGPYLYTTENGELLLLWSSHSDTGYTIGTARSNSGHIEGPWEHNPLPLFAKDGGHGMVFKTLTGELMLTIHSPNKSPNERPIFIKLQETDSGLALLK